MIQFFHLKISSSFDKVWTTNNPNTFWQLSKQCTMGGHGGVHGELCSRLLQLLLLSYWVWNRESGLSVSLSDCSSSLGFKISPGKQEWGDLSRNIFGFDWNSASFCLAIGITDNMSLFFPHWNATMLKVMTRIKRCHRPCLYYSNCSATFRCVMIYEIVFKLNPFSNWTRVPMDR